MYTIKIEEVTRSWLDKLLGRQRFLWAAALCSPNDEWDTDKGQRLVDQRLARIRKDARDYVIGRSGVVAVSNAPLCAIDARLKTERKVWDYRYSRGG